MSLRLETLYDFRKLNNIHIISVTNINEATTEHAENGVVFNIMPFSSINATLLRVSSMSSSLQVASIIR